MSLRVHLTHDARTDLRDIWFHGLDEWGAAQADQYNRRLLTAMMRLGDNPKLGRARPDLGAARRSLPGGSHLILYHVLPNRVEVLRILHQSQDPARHL